jgi:hypothetical protein
MQAGPQTKICPRCKAHNVLSAPRCQCGHAFSTQFTQAATTQTVLGAAPVQPQQPAQAPTVSSVALPQAAPGYIQFYPGAISPIAGLWIGALFPFFAPIYNRQWIKMGIYFLSFASLAYTIFLEPHWTKSLFLMCFAIFTLFDTWLNSVALSMGYPITQTTFLGTPWRIGQEFRFHASTSKYSFLIALVLVSALGSYSVFNAYAEPIRQAEIAKENSKRRENFIRESVASLGIGMSPFQIEEILGEPDFSERDGMKETWRYVEGETRLTLVIYNYELMQIVPPGER